MARNYKGEVLKNKTPEIADVFFLKKGTTKVDWEKFRGEDTDSIGFDIKFPITHIVLKKGTHIIRYGREQGYYTAPLGTPYEKLALPYKMETVEYHEYIVAKDTRVKCGVMEGIVGGNFKSNGGGVQYVHTRSIKELLNIGVLQEVELWKNKE